MFDPSALAGTAVFAARAMSMARVRLILAPRTRNARVLGSLRASQIRVNIWLTTKGTGGSGQPVLGRGCAKAGYD